MSTRSFRSGCTHVLALSFTLTMCGFYQYYIYFKFKIVLYFLVWNICEGRSLKLVNTHLIFYIDLCILLVFACVFGGCSFLVRESSDSCWYSENSSFLHSWASRYDESCLSLGIAIWSFLCSFLYTLNAGISNTFIWFFCKISTEGFTLYSSLFLFPATLTLCSFIPYH